MKKLLSILWAVAGSAAFSLAHGPGHIHRTELAEVNESLDQAAPAPENNPDPTTPASLAESGGKTFQEVIEKTPERNWGASLTTGWESRHVHYGVNETGNHGAWTNELGLRFGDLGVSVWNGFGLGNDFEEWDFTASYAFETGQVFFIPGYNFRWLPESGGHPHSHEEHGEHSEHGHHEDEVSHTHLEYNNELFAILGTNAIPFVTPSTVFMWNLNDAPGGFLEFRIDGNVPLLEDVLALNPYALLGLNFGYNTTAEYGLNNFQFGLQADWRVNDLLTVFAGVNYSIALAALDAIEQGDVFWANAGVSLGF